VAEESALEMR